MPLTALKFLPPVAMTKGKKAKSHFLAVGDAAGTLRIMELPRNLTKPVPNEKALVEALLGREEARVGYVAERAAAREVEKDAKDKAAAEAAAAAAPPPGAWADRPIAASRPELWIGPAVASPF